MLGKKKTYIARVLTLEFNDPKMRKKYNVYKIGSAEYPALRLHNLTHDKLTDYYGEQFLLEATFPMNIENELHRRYIDRRINHGRCNELFYFSMKEMDKIIKDNGFTPMFWEYDKSKMKERNF